MAMKNLMYFVVLDPSNTVLEEEVMNIHWRGLCVETSVPGQFCETPRATWTQANIFLVNIYDKVSANTASSVQKTSKFQSGHKLVKMVLNT